MAVRLTLELDPQDTLRLTEEAARAGKTLEQLLQEKLVGQVGIVSLKVNELMQQEGDQNDQPEQE